MGKGNKVRALLVSECTQYQAELMGSILTVTTWGPTWDEPGQEVGTVDIDLCKVVKYPEDLADMAVLVAAVKALDPGYGLGDFELFIGE